MGCCLSKTESCSKTSLETHENVPKIVVEKADNNVGAEIEMQRKVDVAVEKDKVEKKGEEEELAVAVAVVERKSNDGRQEASDPESIGRNMMAVRTSSCTKEEVDAILIQCGRLSRSSSGNGRKYSGSKRSFDFDRENGNGEEEGGEGEERLRRRESRGSGRRKTTLSRSRERVEQRSGSKERSSGRRVSRSPGRRSESPMPNGNKPGKLVSVPATVTSLSNGSGCDNGNGNGNGNVKRVLVKRNVGSPRCQSPAKGNQGRSQSPAKGNQVSGNGRSQSPAKGIQASGNGQQQHSLSRNGSRKAEQSPYRRTPLNEIDMNSLPFQPLANKRPLNKGKDIEENKYAVETFSGMAAAQGAHRRTRSRGAEGSEVTKTNYCRVNGIYTPSLEQMTDAKIEQLNLSEYEAMVSGIETLKLPQTLVRSRSARRSSDLDVNVDALLTPTTTNYTSLLLQDIQNFHQNKNPNSNSNTHTKTNNTISNNGESTPFTLPPCLSKAHSILEAVADLNSTTRPRPEICSKTDNPIKKSLDDPFVEPSLHKYVTVRKRGGDMDDEESSGSNSVVGNGHQNWVSSSSWEPNSAESADCWTSKSYNREDESSPVKFQRHAISDLACGVIDDSGNKFSRNGRHLQSAPQQQIGAARSRTPAAAGSM